VFANDDAVATMAYLDAYILVSEEGLTTEREIKDSVEALGRQKLAGVVLNKFKGGMLSDGYGVESYYAVGYGEERQVGQGSAPKHALPLRLLLSRRAPKPYCLGRAKPSLYSILADACRSFRRC
jgi:hypothetical protein